MKHRLKVILIGTAVALCILLIFGAFALRFLITSSFPKAEGSIEVNGISANVSIERNSYGIPTIRASNDRDAYFAAGFVHAQDRLWQMELARRAGQGRLSEIFGEVTLDFDRLFRTVNIAGIARRLEEGADPATLEALRAYAQGVNQYISSAKGSYPIEFDMLGIEPEIWKPEHSLIISRLMAWELNMSRLSDGLFLQIIAKTGTVKAKEAIPDWPADAPMILPSRAEAAELASLAAPYIKADLAYRNFIGIPAQQSGSNAWAVSGKRSTTGQAILANDPHLILSAPARWYEMRFITPEMNVYGASLPGIPFVVIGRNERCAWGVTNMMLDDQDLYIETLDKGEAPQYYRFEGMWKPLNVRQDTIHVKNAPSRILTVYSTHRGPIVSAVEPVARLSGKALSMRWVGFEFSEEARAFYLINRARSWDEFKNAVRYFAAPGQNFVFADIDGNIGYIAGGRIPIRSFRSGILPQPGETGEFDWKGYVPFEKNPMMFNPPEGFVATANNKIVGNQYPYYLSNLWEPSYRIERLVELFGERALFSANDFEAMQRDLVSMQAKKYVPRIMAAFAGTDTSSPNVQKALAYLRNWNYQMGPEQVSAAIYEAFHRRLIENTFFDEMGDSLLALYDTIASTPINVLAELMKKDSSSWFDDVRTPKRESADDIIRKSFQEGLELLTRELGADMRAWRWGDIHTIEFEHLFGKTPILRSIFNVGPLPVGGSHATLWKGDYFLHHSFAARVAPSVRFIFDMSQTGGIRSVLPPGQSGQAYHEHYDDQVHLWAQGLYRQIYFTPSLPVTQKQPQVLELHPAGQ